MFAGEAVLVPAGTRLGSCACVLQIHGLCLADTLAEMQVAQLGPLVITTSI